MNEALEKVCPAKEGVSSNHEQYRLHGTVTVQAPWLSYSTGSTVQLQYRLHSTIAVHAPWYSYSTCFMVQLQYRLHGTVTVEASRKSYSTSFNVKLQYRGYMIQLQYRFHGSVVFIGIPNESKLPPNPNPKLFSSSQNAFVRAGTSELCRQ